MMRLFGIIYFVGHVFGFGLLLKMSFEDLVATSDYSLEGDLR